MITEPLTQEEIDKIRDIVNFKQIEKPNITITERQLRIFTLISNGVLGKNIEDIETISHTTLKRDMYKVFDILDVFNKTHAVAQLMRLGLIK